VAAGQPGVADHGVAVHLHQPGGGADAVALGQVLEDRQRLLLGQLGAEQRGALLLREPRLAGAAAEQAAALVLAVAGADRQVVDPSRAEVGATLVQAAEAGQVLRHGDASPGARLWKIRPGGDSLCRGWEVSRRGAPSRNTTPVGEKSYGSQ
jgi:hypothetical protein